MRFRYLLLALALASCTPPPSYDDPKRVGRIDKLREARDLCLLQNVSRFDVTSAEPAKVGNQIAQSCAEQTTKLVEFAVPYPNQQVRAAFEQEAAFRATGYVMTARRMEGDALERQQRQVPLEPPQPLYPFGTGTL